MSREQDRVSDSDVVAEFRAAVQWALGATLLVIFIVLEVLNFLFNWNIGWQLFGGVVGLGAAIALAYVVFDAWRDVHALAKTKKARGLTSR